MAHKTIVNGTIYDVQGGKCLVGGTAYNILKGRTLIGGTGYDISFKAAMPVKGDLITMNLDGSDRLYRVLKVVDETTVEVMTMWNLDSNSAFGSSNTYSGQTLDYFLNYTWYNTLSTAAKAAIVQKAINQYTYTYGSSVYDENTHASYADYSTKALKEYVGVSNVYALDIEDIEMYFGGTGGSASDKTPGTFSTADIQQLFFGDSSPTVQFPWLRSASDISTKAWVVRCYTGYLDRRTTTDNREVRAAFQIDLSKIDFTIN